jgi:hypothetical protein
MSEPYEYEQEAAEQAYIERILKDFGPELYDEHYHEAVQEFTTERLKSYYLKNPAIASAATSVLDEAAALVKARHPNAAFLFYVIAAEITINHLLAKPIVIGLVHNEAVADVVVGLVPYTGSSSFKKLFFGILEKLVAIDLSSYRRIGAKGPLWNEWMTIHEVRNGLVHSGKPISGESLELAEAVALELLQVLFPRVLGKLGLKVNGYLLIEG